VATLQQASFNGLPLIGVDAVIPRGTKPGRFRLRLPHDQAIAIGPGDLSITSDETVTFAGCVPDVGTVRHEHTARNRREWVLTAYDRRATWPGKQVGGNYNRRYRDNTVDPEGKKTAAELADLALTAAGETPSSTAPDTYPRAEWDSSSVPEALNSLSDALPLHVVRNANDTYAVAQTGTGATLQASEWQTVPDYLARVDGGPETIRVRCGPTWFQCGLELECVGLEADGEYIPLTELSYTPSGGWADEWPLFFSGVDQFSRGFAFSSVYRVYRIKVPQTLPFDYTLYDRADILLDDSCVVFGEKHQPEAVVVGDYYPYTDHYENTANCPFHSAGFVLDKELRAVRFDYPVWKAGSCVECADLRLYTGFRLRDHDTKEILHDTFTVSRTGGSGEHIVELPFLWRARSVYANGCSDGTTNDNQTTLEAEARVYLDAWKDHFDKSRDKRFFPYAGTHKIGLSGNIAEVSYRLGRGLTPKTTASEHFRHSLMRT
jgi:hypothetical protein